MKHGLELKAGNGNVVGRRHDFFIGFVCVLEQVIGFCESLEERYHSVPRKDGFIVSCSLEQNHDLFFLENKIIESEEPSGSSRLARTVLVTVLPRLVHGIWNFDKSFQVIL
jgi:hypothetical protein